MNNNKQNNNFNAVVRIDSVHSVPNFNTPWQNKERIQGIGSGVVIEGHRILTNAHNIADATFTTLRKQSSDSIFEAELLAVNHECDLALLTTKDQSFFDDITPMEIGGTPAVQSEVQVVGYPDGGNGLSVTQGIISRIEEAMYAHSSEILLAAQLDAAINPGNSGGPVIYNNKIAGIAFQKLTRRDNIGYMIPTEIIRHFLTDWENGSIEGFGSMTFSYMPLDNPDSRRYLKMKPGQTGVMVYRIEKAAPKGYLQINDVLLAVDGHRIANNGNIRMANQNTMSLATAVRSKQIGEIMEFSILRKGREMVVKIPVCKLEKLCPANLHGVVPEYFVIGGIVFTPLTGNLLDELIEQRDLFCMPSKEDFNMLGALEHYRSLFKEKPGHEVILLHSVLGDETTIGLDGYQMMVLTKINGKPVNSMRQLVETIDRCKGRFVTFTLINGMPLTLDIQRMKAATPRILERYRIPADRSLGFVKKDHDLDASPKENGNVA